MNDDKGFVLKKLIVNSGFWFKTMGQGLLAREVVGAKILRFHNFVSLFRSRLTHFLTFLLLDSDGLMPFRGGDAQMYSSSPYENVAS